MRTLLCFDFVLRLGWSLFTKKSIEFENFQENVGKKLRGRKKSLKSILKVISYELKGRIKVLFSYFLKILSTVSIR